MKFNPFSPGSIVVPGMFAGRADELKELDRSLFQTANGNPRHFLIHGDLGIGKSSLLFYVKNMGLGWIHGLESKRQYKFVTLDVELDSSTTFASLTRKVGADLVRSLGDMEAVRSAAKDAWKFLTNWEILGVKYEAKPSNDGASALLEELCDTITKAGERLKNQSDGFLILIDEADNATADVQLGEWVKIFTERLTKRGCNRVCLGLSGVSSVIDRLKESHESSVRVLHHLLLEPLLPAERLWVIRQGIGSANSKTPESPTKIDPDAAEWIAKYSEGFPHFIQQYAHSAFESDTDGTINLSDVHLGAFKENGALDQLGTRYFNDMYRAQINSDEYRKVLQAIAECPEVFVSKDQIRKATGMKETTLSNAITALKSRNIILPNPEKAGFYRLPNDSFAVWIRAQKKRELEKSHLKNF
jgi:hypothetical protein